MSPQRRAGGDLGANRDVVGDTSAGQEAKQHLGVTDRDGLCAANRLLRVQFVLCHTNPDRPANETTEPLSRSLLIERVELAPITNCCSIS